MIRKHNRQPNRSYVKKSDLDYKRPETLQPFITEFGRIRPRRQTRLSPGVQRHLAREVKRARHLALLPFVSDRYPNQS